MRELCKNRVRDSTELTQIPDILDFGIPASVRLHVSSLSSPNSASSYSLGSSGLLDGSVSYLYTSRALTRAIASTKQTHLQDLFPGYRQLSVRTDKAIRAEGANTDVVANSHDTLFYGRLYLPRSALEALYLRRIGPNTQVKVSYVSDASLPSSATVLAQIQHNAVKHSTEYIFSTDSALLGVKGLYNFGNLENVEASPKPDHQGLLNIPTTSKNPMTSLDVSSKAQGQFSAGGEVYYGLLNKSGGISTGLRFATLPSHTGFPYTMTCTLNPIMGNLSSTYSVLASPSLALSSRFDFNVYSYESGLRIGFELWRRISPQEADELSWAKSKMRSSHKDVPVPHRLRHGHLEGTSGCLKAQLDQKGAIALLWAGKAKQLVYSMGVKMDTKGGENFFKGFGIEFHYSS